MEAFLVSEEMSKYPKTFMIRKVLRYAKSQPTSYLTTLAHLQLVGRTELIREIAKAYYSKEIIKQSKTFKN